MLSAASEAADGRPAKRRSAGMKEMAVPVLCDIVPGQSSKKQRRLGRGQMQSPKGTPFDSLPVSILIDA
jgi:hypothetical protein